MRSHRNQLVGLVLAATVLVACGQPSSPLAVGVREVRNDIVLGAQGDESEPTAKPIATPPPLPPTAVVINVPPPEPRFPPSPTMTPSLPPSPPPPPPPACPEDHPLQAPRLESPRTDVVPPVEETLSFRNDGTFSLSGANANEGVFTGDSLRTVEDVEIADNGDFTYAISAELGGTVTTTTYEVRIEPLDETASPALGAAALQDDRGIYITSVTTEAEDGSTSMFAPNPPLLLLPLPNSNGHAFSAQGVDPLSGTTMSYDGTVGGATRVNACGTPLQGLEVVLTNGQILGPDVNVQFEARYVLATQFGGISIQDEFNIAGTEAGATSSRKNLAIINDLPSYRPETPS